MYDFDLGKQSGGRARKPAFRNGGTNSLARRDFQRRPRVAPPPPFAYLVCSAGALYPERSNFPLAEQCGEIGGFPCDGAG